MFSSLPIHCKLIEDIELVLMTSRSLVNMIGLCVPVLPLR